jgi:hypothetical protein
MTERPRYDIILTDKVAVLFIHLTYTGNDVASKAWLLRNYNYHSFPPFSKNQAVPIIVAHILENFHP